MKGFIEMNEVQRDLEIHILMAVQTDNWVEQKDFLKSLDLTFDKYNIDSIERIQIYLTALNIHVYKVCSITILSLNTNQISYTAIKLALFIRKEGKLVIHKCSDSLFDAYKATSCFAR